MIRFYVLPIVRPPGGPRMPKYMSYPKIGYVGEVTAPFSLKDYGLVDACIMAADVTQAQHDALAAHNDVAAAPPDIDQNVSEGALPTVRAVLEALRIPAEWVDTTHTYRDLLRMVAHLCQFAQRHHGLHNEQLVDNAAQLDLTWNQIPQDRRQRILATADSMGYDYADVLPSWKVRRILRYLADQWGDKPVYFSGFAVL